MAEHFVAQFKEKVEPTQKSTYTALKRSSIKVTSTEFILLNEKDQH